MTHRGNLLAKSGFKAIECVQIHFDFQESLYATLTKKVLSQIHAGYVDDVEALRVWFVEVAKLHWGKKAKRYEV